MFCRVPSAAVARVWALGILLCWGAAVWAQQSTPDQDELSRRLLAADLEEIVGPDGETAYRLPAPDLVAHFVTSTGHEVSFYHSPITEDILYDELADESAALLFTAEDSLLDRYLALLGNDPPDRAFLDLLETRQAEADAYREAEEVLLSSMPVGTPLVGEGAVISSGTQAKGITPSCQSAVTFATNHCHYLNHALIARNRHNPIWCCDENHPGACGFNPGQGNTLWATLHRSTTSLRKNSYSRTAACGAGATVTHWFHAWGTWMTMDHFDHVVPDNKVRTLFLMGGGWWKRKIEFQRNSAGGGLRGYSEFSNP